MATVMGQKHSIQVNSEAAFKLFEPEFGKFYSSLKLNELQEKLKNANSENHKLEYFRWLDFDYLKKTNKQTKELAAKLKFKNALVVGMGGSGINSLVLKNALYEFAAKAQKKSQINLQIQNNLDPSSMIARLESLDLGETLFIIISKSGGTDEVRRNLNTIIDFWKAEGSYSEEKLAKQTVIITEPPRDDKKNFLHELRAEVQNKAGTEIPFLENDPNIGGRFSMFSPVGMLSAELMGLDSEALIAGAESCFTDFVSSSIEANQIAKLAAFDIFLSRKNFHNRYSMVYSDSLEAFNKFRAQLKGESLNKNGIDSTIHIPGTGTVNHHSDLELLLKQNNGVILEQVYFEKPSSDHQNQTNLDCLNDLNSQSNHKSLIENHIQALYDYLLENKAPVIQISIPEQNEKSLGYLLMQDMLCTVVQAGLQDEDGKNEKLDLAIRQWEVERYKKSIRDKKS